MKQRPGLKAFPIRFLIRGGLLLAAAMVSAAVSANTNQKVGMVGPFEIIRIYEGNDYKRCAASLGNGKDMLRLAYTADHKNVISVFGVKQKSGLIMYIDPPGNTGNDLSFAVQTDGNRTWGEVNEKLMHEILKIKKLISIEVDGQKKTWNIGNTSLAEVMTKVRQCVK